jgi:hypothetical protein
MWWLLLSDSLKGHVREARLVESGADSIVLLELPADSGGGNEALRGRLSPYQGPVPFDDLVQLVLEGRVAMDLGTDAPGREFLRQRLIPGPYEGWDRPHCG